VSRNLALPNSFSLDMTNNSSSTFTFNLFNLGGALQTPITSQQTLNTILNLDISAFVDSLGNCIQLTDIVIYTLTPSFTLLGTVTLAIGQNILTSQISLNPVIGTNGVSGTFQMSYSSTLSNQIVNVSIGGANAEFFRMTQFPGPAVINDPFQTTIATFVTTNPLVTLGGTIPFNEILNSETGNSYKIDGIDIISNNGDQIFEDMTYGFKDVNGNKVRLSTANLVDVYQPQSTSLQDIDTTGFVIDSETLFTYPILSYTFARITFNYVRAQLSAIKEFNQALAQEFVYESDKLYKELQVTDSKRYILYQ